MEMSQRTHFWYQNWPKMLIAENAENHFFGKKNFCDKLKQ